jgi:hypothetical protein
MNPSISAVIPSYNVAAYLGQALDSVLGQTLPPLEVIVVDDGSTDASAAVAESYGPPVRVIRQKNQGPSIARNRGLDEARGEWVAFLDGDDYWLPGKLEKQVAAIEPDVVMLHTNWHNFGARDEIRDPAAIPVETRYSIEQLFTAFNPLHLSCVLVRRGLPVRFPTWTRYAEDILYYAEVSLRGRIALVPEVLMERRVHGSSLSAAPDALARIDAACRQWLEGQRETLGDSRVQAIAGRMLARLVEATWAAYWRRQWAQFEALRAYLRPFADQPEVGPLLDQRVWPRWFYTWKDVCDRLRRSVPGLGGPKIETAKR